MFRTSQVVPLLFTVAAVVGTVRAELIDSITMGDATSEQSHAIAAVRSEIIEGALGARARQLLPLDPPSWDGGRVAFTVKVDPEKPNYLTVKIWGSEVGEERG